MSGCTDTCGRPQPGVGWSHCSTCHEDFNSDAAFDMHRTGRFGIDRRCKTPDEMHRAGQERNKAGRWVTRPRPGSGPS